MHETEIESIRQELEEGEAALDPALFAEYSKRRRCVDLALKDYIKNDDDVNELNNNRVENYAKLDKIRDRFLMSSLILFIAAFFSESLSPVLLVIYVFAFAYFARNYYDVRSNDGMQLTNLVMCQFEKQRLIRDISVSGVSDGDVERYRHEISVIKGRQEIPVSNDATARLDLIELRMAKAVMQNLRNL